MNLHKIGNTFVNIQINSQSLHFHQCSDWFQIVCDRWIYLYCKQSEKIFGQMGPGLYINKQSFVLTLSMPGTLYYLRDDVIVLLRVT